MFKSQATFGVAVILTLVGAGVLCVVAWAVDGKEFYHDFRGRTPPVGVQLSGPQVGRFAKVDADGLRINLPKDRRNRAQVGITVPLTLHGDFEATATFHILRADTPPTGYGVGAIAGVDDRARVGRFVRPDGEQVILWDFWPVVDGVRKMEGEASPCIATEGRLRLKRTGTILHIEWAPDVTGDDFQELHATEYGTEDPRFFTFVAESSGQPCGVDIRLSEFRARAVSAAAPRLRWSAAALAAVGVAGAGLLGVGRFRRTPARPPRHEPEKVAVDDEPAADDDGQVQCPTCQQHVKVSGAAAGKKVKCPGCGAAFVAS